MRFQGRSALVTGAAGDIGRAIVRRLAAEGARIAAVDRDAAALARALADLGAAAVPIVADLGDRAACARAVAEAAGQGGLDILVNNAAMVTRAATVAELTETEWEETLTVNLTAAFVLSKHAVEHMRARGGGVVVNVASQLGHVASRGRCAYSVSKAGLIALTRSLAVDHAADGIRAVSVSPGSVMTGRLLDRYGSAEAVTAALAPKHPVGRIGTPEEIAAVVAFAASDEAAFVTGADILADGAYTAV